MKKWIVLPAIIVLFFAVGLMVFQTSLSNPFVLDDLTKIQENLDLRTPFEFSHFVYPYGDRAMHFRNDPSRPLTFMVWWICWHIDRGSPIPFHVVNIILHILNALMVGWLTTKILRRWTVDSPVPGVVSGLLFLSSPLMAGTAAYAYGLSDVLSTALLLLALLSLTGKLGWPNLLIGACCFVLALATKQSAIVLPGLIVLIDFFTGKASERARWWRLYTPLGILAAFYLALRLAYFGALGDLEGQAGAFHSGEYLSSQGLMILKYIGLTVWPHGLSVDHLETPDHLSQLATLVAWIAVVFVSLTALEIGFRSRRAALWKMAGLGWCFFLLCLLPVSSVFPTVDLFVERRAYMADIGLFMAVAGVAYFLSQRSQAWRWGLATITTVILVAQGALAMQRSEVYGIPEALWKEALALDSQNGRALINLGVYYSSAGRLEESRQVLETLLRSQPENGSLYSKLGYIFMNDNYAHHDLNLAESYMEKAIRFAPENIFAFYNFGILKMKRQQYDQAEKYFREAIRLAPQMTMAVFAAGQSARLQGHKQDAEQFFEETLRLDPDHAIAKRELEKLRQQ